MPDLNDIAENGGRIDAFGLIVGAVLTQCNVRFPDGEDFDPTPFCDEIRHAAECGYCGEPVPAFDADARADSVATSADPLAEAHARGVALAAVVGAAPAPAAA